MSKGDDDAGLTVARPSLPRVSPVHAQTGLPRLFGYYSLYLSHMPERKKLKDACPHVVSQVTGHLRDYDMRIGGHTTPLVAGC